MYTDLKAQTLALNGYFSRSKELQKPILTLKNPFLVVLI